MSIRHRLSEEIETELERLKTMKPGSDEYRAAVDGLTKLVDREIEMEKLENEREEKANNRLIEDQNRIEQTRRDNLHRWVEHGIAVGSVVLPLLVAVWGTKASFSFEKEDTVTTIMGRGWVNKLLPRK